MANFEAFVEKIGGRWFKVGDVIVEICASNSGFLKNEITWKEYYEMNYTKIKDQLIKHEGNYCRVWIVLGRARTGNPMIRRNS